MQQPFPTSASNLEEVSLHHDTEQDRSLVVAQEEEEIGLRPLPRVQDNIKQFIRDIIEAYTTPGSRSQRFLDYSLGWPFATGTFVWRYFLNQIYLLYPSSLVGASLVTNPAPVWFMISIVLFCSKILQESHLDSYFRDKFNYSSRISTDVTLACFFCSIFGLILKFKTAAGIIDDSWYTSWWM